MIHSIFKNFLFLTGLLIAISYVQLAWSDNKALSTKPLLLFFETEDCPYCHLIKETFLNIEIQHNHLRDRLTILPVDLDASEAIAIKKDVEPISATALKKRYGVKFTPTMIWVNPYTLEAIGSLIGVSNIEYYGFYFNQQTDLAHIKLATYLETLVKSEK